MRKIAFNLVAMLMVVAVIQGIILLAALAVWILAGGHQICEGALC